ncbi:winged helix-turn-helix transcriptional regulator [Bacillus pumilus]|uniref:Lrp/AsnC family transcriptional regulator n=2 Tax=Bacillaceae TaxID=186817 RepID=UPI0011A8AB74|nr:Lrp/AsnC family transcriptional regulator [Bacillus pumilus]QHQ75613.1 winged helix-turn-helix transcriptional regulator [Bacillus pumilus]
MKVFHQQDLIFERGEPMLDQTDMDILKELSKNSRLTMKALGEKVHLTGQAVANRVLKLEEEGVIEAYTISIDWRTQKTIQTFMQLYTRSHHHEPLLSFLDRQEEIKNLFKISGEGCYMAEGHFSSHDELDLFLTELTNYANYKLSIAVKRLIHH